MVKKISTAALLAALLLHTAVPATALSHHKNNTNCQNNATHKNISGHVATHSPRNKKFEQVKFMNTNMKVKQLSKTHVKTSGYLSLAVKKQRHNIKAEIGLDPYGPAAETGKTQRKKLTLKWSKKYKAYRAKFSFTTKAPGVLQSVAINQNRIFTTTRNTVRPPSQISSRTSKASYVKPKKAATITIKVTPAYGRKIFVERYTGNKWVRVKTIKTAKNKKTATIRVSLAAPKKVAVHTYRIYAPATRQANQSGIIKHSVGLASTAHLKETT